MTDLARTRAGGHRALLVVAGAVLAVALPADAEGQIALSAYGGMSSTFDSDVHLREPHGDDLVFRGVSWDGRSFEGPMYWGLRFTYWFRTKPRWGIVGDLTHAKIHADLNETVRVTGTRNGEPVDARELLGATFDNLAMSHGYNLATVNAFFRWSAVDSEGRSRRLTPYVGFGAGIVVPHAEVMTSSTATEDYQATGPVLQGLGGVDLRLVGGLSVFGELRMSSARVGVDLDDGGTLSTDPWTGHLSIGLSYRFR